MRLHNQQICFLRLLENKRPVVYLEIEVDEQTQTQHQRNWTSPGYDGHDDRSSEAPPRAIKPILRQASPQPPTPTEPPRDEHKTRGASRRL